MPSRKPAPKRRANTADAGPAVKKITITVNPDTLTLGELEDFAEAAGVEFNEAATIVEVDGRPVKRLRAKSLTTLVWILQRREDPNFTLEDARQVKVTSLDIPAEKKSNPTRRGA